MHVCLPSFVCVLSSFDSLHSFPSLSLSPSHFSLLLSPVPTRHIQTHTLSFLRLCPAYHSHRLCSQRIWVCPPFFPRLCFSPCFFCLAQNGAACVCYLSGGGGCLTSRGGGERGRKSCAGRKDALAAAASDSISMNFTAEAAAAVAAASSSDSLPASQQQHPVSELHREDQRLLLICLPPWKAAIKGAEETGSFSERVKSNRS